MSEHESMRDSDGLHDAPIREIVENDTALVIRLAGELDLYNADAVREALFAAAERGPRRLVVDLEAVRFIDSTALGVLIEARSKLSDGDSFVLAAPSLETQRALEVSGLDRHFNVERSVDEAVAAGS